MSNFIGRLVSRMLEPERSIQPRVAEPFETAGVFAPNRLDTFTVDGSDTVSPVARRREASKRSDLPASPGIVFESTNTPPSAHDLNKVPYAGESTDNRPKNPVLETGSDFSIDVSPASWQHTRDTHPERTGRETRILAQETLTNPAIKARHSQPGNQRDDNSDAQTEAPAQKREDDGTKSAANSRVNMKPNAYPSLSELMNLQPNSPIVAGKQDSTIDEVTRSVSMPSKKEAQEDNAVLANTRRSGTEVNLESGQPVNIAPNDSRYSRTDVQANEDASEQLWQKEKPAVDVKAIEFDRNAQPRTMEGMETRNRNNAPFRERQPDDQPPAIHITIGRIEIRAVTPNKPVPEKQEKREPMLTLAEYLKKQHEGSR